jgi:hypothetical protein
MEQNDRITQQLLKSIERQTDRARLEQQMRNAEGRNETIYNAARDRRDELLSVSPELAEDFQTIMDEYEAFMSEQTGRRYVAHATWKMIRNRGIRETLEIWCTSTDDQSGFSRLADIGRYDITAEFIVLKHADEFERAVVQGAKQRLLRHGCPPSELP